MREPGFTTLAATCLVAGATLVSACAQHAGRASYEAEELFEDACAGCHTAAGGDRTPGTMLLRALSPRAIVASLEDGVMRAEGADLTREQRIGLAEYLAGREHVSENLPESAFLRRPRLAGPGAGRGRLDGMGREPRGDGIPAR